MSSTNGTCRIVLTGGPGAGKTTAADLLRREIGDSIVVVPEAATMLFSGGFPRLDSPEEIRQTQSAIFHVQKSLETIQTARFPDRTLLCDRGTLDSSVYWPSGPDDFFKELNTTIEDELKRYEVVVFFETAAVGKINIEGGNPIRNETLDEAIALDRKLRAIWEKHPSFHFIAHESSFMKKINKAHECIQCIIEKHNGK